MRHYPQSLNQHGAVQSTRRAAYTLLELLLVLTVLAVVVAVAWPNILRLNNQQKLIDSAEKVRAVAASARVHAIDSGLIYQFRYEPGGSNFIVVPFEKEFEGVSPNARGTGTALGRFSKAAGTLPKGIHFAAPTLPGTGSSVTSTNSSLGSALGQKLPSGLLAGLPNASKLESVSWSGPVQFHSDGSAADFSVDLTDNRHQRITLRIRGITGGISVSRVHQSERL